MTKDYFGRDLLVPAVCTLGGVMFSLYAAQLLITRRDGYPFALAIKVIGPIGSICMNLWKTQAKEQNLYHVFLMINYDAIFFSQGVIDMCYWRKMLKARGKVTETVATPLIIFLTILMYAICSPMNYSNMGHLFFYPLYTDYWLQCLYTTGTWIFMFGIVWLMAVIANDKFNDTFYKYVTGSALYAYLSHYFFILIISVGIIRPYHLGFIPALFIMLFGTLLLIFLTYWVLNAIYELIFPPKETKAHETKSESEEAAELSPEE